MQRSESTTTSTSCVDSTRSCKNYPAPSGTKDTSEAHPGSCHPHDEGKGDQNTTITTTSITWDVSSSSHTSSATKASAVGIATTPPRSSLLRMDSLGKRQRSSPPSTSSPSKDAESFGGGHFQGHAVLLDPSLSSSYLYPQQNYYYYDTTRTDKALSSSLVPPGTSTAGNLSIMSSHGIAAVANSVVMGPRSIHSYHNQDPCVLLQQSLKRVRLSSTPGEIRLHRDLKHLVHQFHWTYITDDCNEDFAYYQSPPSQPFTIASSVHSNRLFETEDPLVYVLKVQNQHTVWFKFHHLYPHRPPMVSNIESPDHHIHNIVVCEPHSCPTSTMPQGTAVYQNWTSIHRLDQVIHFCIDLFTRHKSFSRDNYCTGGIIRDHASYEGDSDMAMWMAVQPPVDLPSSSIHEDPSSVFFPNRFDQGYDKHETYIQHMDQT